MVPLQRSNFAEWSKQFGNKVILAAQEEIHAVETYWKTVEKPGTRFIAILKTWNIRWEEGKPLRVPMVMAVAILAAQGKAIIQHQQFMQERAMQ